MFVWSFRVYFKSGILVPLTGTTAFLWMIGLSFLAILVEIRLPAAPTTVALSRFFLHVFFKRVGISFWRLCLMRALPWPAFLRGFPTALKSFPWVLLVHIVDGWQEPHGHCSDWNRVAKDWLLHGRRWGLRVSSRLVSQTHRRLNRKLLILQKARAYCKRLRLQKRMLFWLQFFALIRGIREIALR